MLEPHQVIKRPVITEKSNNLTNWSNQYSFIVDKRANKIDVRKAVERRWGVRVESVQVIAKKGKPRRIRWNRWGKKPDWKKAIVRIHKDDAIDIF
jgi:large subunit ribosomal protein L23